MDQENSIILSNTKFDNFYLNQNLLFLLRNSFLNDLLFTNCHFTTAFSSLVISVANCSLYIKRIKFDNIYGPIRCINVFSENKGDLNLHDISFSTVTAACVLEINQVKKNSVSSVNFSNIDITSSAAKSTININDMTELNKCTFLNAIDIRSSEFCMVFDDEPSSLTLKIKNVADVNCINSSSNYVIKIVSEYQLIRFCIWNNTANYIFILINTVTQAKATLIDFWLDTTIRTTGDGSLIEQKVIQGKSLVPIEVQLPQNHCQSNQRKQGMRAIVPLGFLSAVNCLLSYLCFFIIEL